MIWAMGDLHLDGNQDKPMDIFGKNWDNHIHRIFADWEKKIGPEDMVLIPGDISWALKLDEAVDDLRSIHEMPGEKFLIKGNHDYWWASLKKMEELGFDSIHYIHNNAFTYRGIGVAGSRAWSDVDGISTTEHDERIYNREIARLKLSLEELKKLAERETVKKTVVMLHYPPFSAKGEPNAFTKVLEDYGVDFCIYGHLHGTGHSLIVEEILGGVEYLCVASDYLDFEWKEISGGLGWNKNLK